MSITTGMLVADLQHRFQAAGLPEPKLDARLLLSHLLGYGLTDLTVNPDRILSDDEVNRVRSAADRRCQREPVHRILGRRAFHAIELELSPATLEPRPDTETLVETALPRARAKVLETGTCRIADLGTGSGAICLALLVAVPEAVGLGTDISLAALETALLNARSNGVSRRFTTCHGHWFDAVCGTFDLIVSNPPYIPSADIAALEPEVREFDPPRALDGGPDGLDAYRHIAAGAGAHLAEGGYVCLETAADQHRAVIDLFHGHGFACVERARDMAGHDRAVVFQRGDSLLTEADEL
ncbi:MAG: peptide chain release factor N(5)-glutamine methyltransferase [Pseudomonadota bacterium]